MKTNLKAFLTEATFDQFKFDGDENFAELHHEAQCHYGNYLDLNNPEDLANPMKFIENFEYQGSFSCVVFDRDAQLSEPPADTLGKNRNNPRYRSVDGTPKGTIFIDETHLDSDVVRKLAKFLKSKNLSLLIEPIYV